MLLGEFHCLIGKKNVSSCVLRKAMQVFHWDEIDFKHGELVTLKGVLFTGRPWCSRERVSVMSISLPFLEIKVLELRHHALQLCRPCVNRLIQDGDQGLVNQFQL